MCVYTYIYIYIYIHIHTHTLYIYIYIYIYVYVYIYIYMYISLRTDRMPSMWHSDSPCVRGRACASARGARCVPGLSPMKINKMRHHFSCDPFRSFYSSIRLCLLTAHDSERSCLPRRCLATPVELTTCPCCGRPPPTSTLVHSALAQRGRDEGDMMI